MKSFVLLTVLGGSVLAETAQFTNTTFNGPFSVGQTVPLMWTIGNGETISLSITNATWSYALFSDRAVLPTNYSWIVTAPTGFVSGSYQLDLEQLNGSLSQSPVFNVIVPSNDNSASTTAAASVSSVPVPYVYWDDTCGCKKTGTAWAPLNTGMAVSTTKWWDDQCGCHKSAVVPVTTLPAANNYTVPAAPPSPVTTTPMTSAMSGPMTTTRTSATTTWTGEAVRMEQSVFGVMAAIVAMALA